MKILKCHCGEVEIQVDLKKEIDQLKDVIVQCAKEKEQWLQPLINKI